MLEKSFVEHSFPAYINLDSKILILGSFPSRKSREESFYYAHPQNRFWLVLSKIYQDKTPLSLQDKKDFLKKHQIALYDVIDSCFIKGSSDLSIEGAKPTDIGKLIKGTQIEKIILNGKTAGSLFKNQGKSLNLPFAVLPSTSPANASFSLDRLVEEWEKEF